MKMSKSKNLISGKAAHRRTESDYLGVLLETVSLDDWRKVVEGALCAAKEGNPAARAWLAQYLIGKPDGKAPTPLTVVVQQWSGNDPVTDKLAASIAEKELFGSDQWKENIRTMIADELAQKLPLEKIGSL